MEERKTYIKNIDGKWYAFRGCGNQVYSIGGIWGYMARWTDDGIKYVSKSSPSRSAAYQKARRYGKYCGEI